MSSREQVEGAAVRALPLIKLACSLLSRSNQRGSPNDRPAPSLPGPIISRALPVIAPPLLSESNQRSTTGAPCCGPWWFGSGS